MGDAQKLREAGFGDLIAPPPPLTNDTAQALHCWAWCDGWHPERLPLYAALHTVDDLSIVIELQEHLRIETRKT